MYEVSTVYEPGSRSIRMNSSSRSRPLLSAAEFIKSHCCERDRRHAAAPTTASYGERTCHHDSPVPAFGKAVVVLSDPEHEVHSRTRTSIQP